MRAKMVLGAGAVAVLGIFGALLMQNVASGSGPQGPPAPVLLGRSGPDVPAPKLSAPQDALARTLVERHDGSDLDKLLAGHPHRAGRVTAATDVATGRIGGAAVELVFSGPVAFSGHLPGESSSPDGRPMVINRMTSIVVFVDLAKGQVISAMPSPGSDIVPTPPAATTGTNTGGRDGD